MADDKQLDAAQEKLTAAEKEQPLSDSFTGVVLRVIGSWRFITFFLLALIAYAAANIVLKGNAWDPYPFILLNLFLSVGGSLVPLVVLLVIQRMERSARERRVNAIGASDVSAVVEQIFDSDKFLTTLRTALPTGDSDEKYGFDFIPYLLHSIDERRRRAAREAVLFLTATITAAFVFSGVVVYFGYILVNEAGAGSAKALAGIQESTSQIANQMPALTGKYNERIFQTKARSTIATLRKDQTADPRNPLVKAAIDHAEASTDETIEEFINELNKIGTPSNTNFLQDAYTRQLTSALQKLNSISDEMGEINSTTRNHLANLQPLIENANKALTTPEYRTAELIKRLALGIVVSTFFLALLRYLGGLYKVRYEQVIGAEQDDFMVRRFYVAFKNSTESEEQRKVVLAGFISRTPAQMPSSELAGIDDSSKQSFDLLKEVLAALTKKI